MTRETAKKFLPIITAFANGEMIEQVCQERASEITELYMDNCPETYRIRKKPREWWLADGVAYQSKEAAKLRGLPGPIIHVIEDLVDSK